MLGSFPLSYEQGEALDRFKEQIDLLSSAFGGSGETLSMS